MLEETRMREQLKLATKIGKERAREESAGCMAARLILGGSGV